MQPVLSDIVVVDLTENLAGPFCTQILADMGADVIKVERPDGGDPARAWGPPFWGEDATIFLSANRNKRSVVLDLATEPGRDALRRLVRRADVFAQSFRAGVIDALGFAYDDARSLNPRLVYASVTAFGARGPLRELPGYDPLLQAYAGLMSVNGHADRPPARVGTSVVDLGTGMWTALGILGALRDRDRTGRGAHVGTALYDTAVAWMGYHLMGYWAAGVVPGPHGTGLPMIAPYEAFPTADGQLMIAAANDALFERLCAALGEPALARVARFADNRSRVANRVALVDRIAAFTRARTTDALASTLRRAGVPCAPIRDVAGVDREPQTAASGIVQAVAHPAVPDFRSVGLPVEWDGRRPPARRAPPRPGEHTREVLRELGYSPEEAAALDPHGGTASDAPSARRADD